MPKHVGIVKDGSNVFFFHVCTSVEGGLVMVVVVVEVTNEYFKQN